MFLKAKAYKLVFKYDLINTLIYIHENGLTVRGKIGENPERVAMIASENNSIHTMKYLITKMNLNVSFDEEHILKDALEYGFYGMAQLVMQYGANIQNCSSSMTDACLVGNINTVKFMFDNGFKGFNCMDECIIFACEHDHLDILKLLLYKGFSISKMLYESLEYYSSIECYEYLAKHRRLKGN